MSRARICDSRISQECVFPFVFAAGAEGSTELSGQKNRRYKDGEQFTESVSKDFCPHCVAVMEGRALPKGATTPAESNPIRAIKGTIIDDSDNDDKGTMVK